MTRHQTGIFMMKEVAPPIMISGGRKRRGGSPGAIWIAPSIMISGELKPQTPDLSQTELLERLESDCFICHTSLVKGKTDSNEDVFPQWLQELFDLKDEMINLIDGSGKKYKDILVPCCQSCNRKYMSNVETRIATSVKQGFSEFIKLRLSDIFLWTAKIFYGLLHLEVKPRHPKKKYLLDPILPSQVLEPLELMMMLLKGFRKRVIVNAPKRPFSILLFHLKTGGPPKLNFNYWDSVEWPTALAVRLGSIGVIVSFADFGYLEQWFENRVKPIVEGRALHPAQFAEIVAHAFYWGGLVGFNVTYTEYEGPNDLFLQLRQSVTSGREPDFRRLAATISECRGVSLDQIWDDHLKQPKSILLKKDNTFLDLPLEEGV